MILLTGAIIGLFLLPQPWNVIVLCAVVVIEVAEIYAWIWFLKRYRIRTGAEGLVGERGTVESSLDPEGRVKVHGELWRARSSESLDAGEEIEVEAIDGLTLDVRRAGARVG